MTYSERIYPQQLYRHVEIRDNIQIVILEKRKMMQSRKNVSKELTSEAEKQS